MNLMPRLCNVCKYTGIQFRIKTCQAIFIDRKWLSTKTESRTVEKLKKSDGVDEKFELIYRPPNSEQLAIATAFCSISSFTIPMLLGQYAYDKFFDQNLELLEQVSTFQITAMEVAGILSWFSLYFCRLIAMRIYHHEKEYIAILPSVIPGMKREIRFKKGEIKDKKNSSEFLRNTMTKVLRPGFEGSRFFKVNNKRIFLNTRAFIKPVQFLEMFPNTAKYNRIIKQLENK